MSIKNILKNSLRTLNEAPEDELDMSMGDVGNDLNQNSDIDSVDDKIEIYYSNLDQTSQQKVMSALKKQLNATDDDSIAENNISEQLSKQPLFVIMGEELQRQLQLKI